MHFYLPFKIIRQPPLTFNLQLLYLTAPDNSIMAIFLQSVKKYNCHWIKKGVPGYIFREYKSKSIVSYCPVKTCRQYYVPICFWSSHWAIWRSSVFQIYLAYNPCSFLHKNCICCEFVLHRIQYETALAILWSFRRCNLSMHGHVIPNATVHTWKGLRQISVYRINSIGTEYLKESGLKP